MRRCLIIDPACVQTFGHNLAALSYFDDQAREMGFITRKIASTDLPEAVAAEASVERRFTNYYSEILGPNKGRQKIPKHRDIAELAFKEAREFIQSAKLTSDDIVFFPSADYYGAQAFLRALMELNTQTAPTLLLRLIGVLETVSRDGSNSLADIVSLVERGRSQGLMIRLSTETPIYSRFISERSRTVVPVIPYPVIGDLLPVPCDTHVVACPGSSRFDKGYLRLFNIIAEVKKRDPLNAIKFVMQELGPQDSLHCQNYTSQLYALPGTTLLDSNIGSTEMKNLYQDSRFVLMPYDVMTYQFRGSAVLMEAIGYGRSVIATEGTGFADQIRFYGCGELCVTDEQFASAILSAVCLEADLLEQRARQARARFVVDSWHSMKSWMQTDG